MSKEAKTAVRLIFIPTRLWVNLIFKIFQICFKIMVRVRIRVRFKWIGVIWPVLS